MEKIALPDVKIHHHQNSNCTWKFQLHLETLTSHLHMAALVNLSLESPMKILLLLTYGQSAQSRKEAILSLWRPRLSSK